MKKRLDQLIFDKGLVESRTKAQAVIMSGNVYVDGKKIDKVGTQVKEDAEICVKDPFPYVSRGALKLEKAAQEFDIDFKDKTICDIGSSTGGFTDFALQNGAKKVFAVDVGTGQLAQKIREDERVEVYEKTDFRDFIPISCHSRDLSIEALAKLEGGNPVPERIDLFVCDVSFISLKRIIPKIAELVTAQCHPDQENRVEGSLDNLPDLKVFRAGLRDDNFGAEAILLIKPQFEVGKKEADRGKGVITDPELHNAVIQDIQDFTLEQGFKIKGIVLSPITGAKGNKEFLLYIVK